MFDRPESGERAVLVHINLHAGQEDLNELKELARSAGAEVVHVLTGSRRTPDPKYFIGTGKLEELKAAIEETEADLVLFNHVLSPSQQRNLEAALEFRVVDRNGLILDIFALRAKTYDGKLQVELAQLNHLSTRLTRGWTHLDRQKGGIGMRGTGETQLEDDRRQVAMRIKLIQGRLEKVVKQRHQGRARRKRAEIPNLSLVGYTNAGKSTLFNALTGADIYAANQLFATLDPTLRRFKLANASEVVLADTVGFIRHLPHELVAAFKSTLQEATEADLLLHIIDASDENRDETIFEVNQVLKEIGADTNQQLEVFNKIDLLDGFVPRIDRNEQGKPRRVWLSAQTGAGMELLLQALAEIFSATKVKKLCHLLPSQGGVRAKLFSVANILQEDFTEQGGWDLAIEIDQQYMGILKDVDIEEIM
ncbi:MAG: GTPase HflX [Gammaproteobacteria bacterium]|nr:MAG: GTPase HflX [Gammaproteobacteria bacterium]